MKVVHHRDELARESLNAIRLCACRGCLVRCPALALQRLLGAPTRGQRRIVARCALECGEGFGGLSFGSGEMPCLLPGAAVFGHRRVKPIEKRARLVAPLEIATGHGSEIQRFPVGGIGRQHPLGLGQSACEIARLQRRFGRLYAFILARHGPCLQRKTAEASPPWASPRRRRLHLRFDQ